MYNNKKPLSIKIIYWMTEVIFWFFMLVLTAAVAFNIALQFELLGDKMQLHAGLPFEVNYTQPGSLEYFDAFQKVEFVDAVGKIHFIDTDPHIAKWFGAAMLVVLIVSIYIFLMFRRFIGNVYRGFIFEDYNIRMFKKMSYGLVAFWIIAIIYNPLFYYFIGKNLEFEHLTVSSTFPMYPFILLAALFLWVLSHIFLVGVKLQKEQELTV